MTPPPLARWLVRLAATRADREAIIDDLQDEFCRRTAREGRRRARRWYWRQARRSVGPLLRVRAARAFGACRTAAIVPVAPVRDGLRWIRRHPRLAAVAVGTIAVASGTALAAGALVHTVVLSELPFPGSDRLVTLWNAGPALAAGVRSSSFQDLEDWRAESSSIAAISGETATSFTLTGRGDARTIAAARVGLDFDRVLGIRPAAGRLFSPGDFEAGAHLQVVLTHSFWQREFGGGEVAVGQTLLLDDRAHRIVGVLPPMPTSYPAYAHEVWVPLIARPGVRWEHSRGTTWLNAVARLKPGVSIDAARAELSAIAASLRTRYPDSNGTRVAMELRPLRDEIAGDSARPLMLLGAAVVAVLLVAWANLTTLLMSGATRRRQEFAVRLAIGADRRTMLWQISVESLVLALTGVGAGLALVPLLLKSFVALHPGALPRAGEVGAGPGLAAVAAALAVLGAALLALPQIRYAADRRLPGEVRHGARLTSSRSERRARTMLLGGQVAFSVVLLVSGLLFARTLLALAAIDPGFQPNGVLTFSVSPSPARFGSAASTREFFANARQALQTLPGARRVAAATAVPFVSRGWQFPIDPDGQSGRARTLVGVTIVSPDYFDALGMRLVEGRDFDGAEHAAGGAPVVIVNDVLAGLLFPGGSAAGQRLDYDGARAIVGVVRGTRRRLAEPAAPELYMPWHNAGRAPQRMIVQTGGDPLELMPGIAARLHAIDPGAPISGVERLHDVVNRSLAPQRFRAILVTLLAAVAVVLSGLGVYSVTAFALATQRKENSIRRALGEPSQAAARRIVASAIRPAAVGTLAGLGVVAALAPLLQAFLFDVDARDPRLLGAVGVLLLGVSAAAALAPARAALRADLLGALRDE